MKLSGWIFASLLATQPSAISAAPTQDAEGVQALRLAADHVESDYVDAANAKAIAVRLRKEATNLRRNPKDGEALAAYITKLLRSLSKDEHIGLRFSPEAMPANIFAERTGAEALAATARTARVNNFGVVRAERLPGNIGFLDLDAFTSPENMRKPLAAAMELLRHCDAMIIDLRFNGGGHAGGAALAASYFLPEAPTMLLARFETRRPGEALEIRTEGTLEAGRFLDRPVYILTGPGTFSAAEFFASVLQQSARATVVGVRTRGGVHPSARIRLTPHFGMMLPTTGNVRGTKQGAIEPDVPSAPQDALVEARRSALGKLLAARPNDTLAEDWRRILADLASKAPGAPAPQGGAAN